MDNNVKWVATLASCALVGAAGYIAMKQNPKMANDCLLYTSIDTMYGEKKCKKADVLLEKCLSCKGKKHMIYDELISENEDEIDVYKRQV